MPANGDYIADYLSGSLSPGEMKEFESRLTTDEELNKEYQLLAKGMDYIKGRVMLEEVEKDRELPGVEAEVEAYFAEQRGATPKCTHRRN